MDYKYNLGVLVPLLVVMVVVVVVVQNMWPSFVLLDFIWWHSLAFVLHSFFKK